MILTQAGENGDVNFAFGPFPPGSLVRSLMVSGYEDIEAELIEDGTEFCLLVAAAFSQSRPDLLANVRRDIVRSPYKIIHGGPGYSSQSGETNGTPPVARVAMSVFASSPGVGAQRYFSGPQSVFPVNRIVTGGWQWVLVNSTTGLGLGSAYVCISVDALPPSRRHADVGWPIV